MFNAKKQLSGDPTKTYYSLPALEKEGLGKISRLPVSIRIVLESVLRNCDGELITEKDVRNLAAWDYKKPSTTEVPFTVSRVLLQDFTGVPLLVDLASMRDAVSKLGKDPKIIEPLVPVDLVVDHSVQVDRSATNDSFEFNLETEFERNRERYEFLKWGQNAFDTLQTVPPGIGICHQVNLELFGTVVTSKDGIYFPDTLVGTDSHTTMINGLGVVGWGVGGIEAEAAMLGQPVYIQMPEVIGVHLTGKLKEGVTATDLTLRITELLRSENVVGKFVEYFGEGAATLPVADRATIANMSPEYGATIGFFPADEKTLEYMAMTGRSEAQISLVKEYLEAQGLFGIPRSGEVDYNKVVELDLSSVVPCVSGPKRPQDRIDLVDLKDKFYSLMTSEEVYNKTKKDLDEKVCIHGGGSYSLENMPLTGGTANIDSDGGEVQGWDEAEMVTNRPSTSAVANPTYAETCDMVLKHGSIVIAAITSCTNTSNPAVMVGAGLVAKRAIEKGLRVPPQVKTSLAPGSRVVTDYLDKTGLQKYLSALGFQLVAYGCTTCIGNSGPLEERIESAIKEHDLVTASVLSGNRNFEARIHSAVKANFLMSPPLVVAFALAGRVDIDMDKEPLGYGRDGKPVFLRDLWPTSEEIQKTIAIGLQPEMFKNRYANVKHDNPVWTKIKISQSAAYNWDEESTYIQNPPYFDNFSLDLPEAPKLDNLIALAIFGNSVTTDHISPAGAFNPTTPAGEYLTSKGVSPKDFNSFGSRRGNHNVMMRGTFGNVRIRNHLAEGKEGGFTKMHPDGELTTIFDAAMKYQERGQGLIIFTGKDYGMGSSRDWAAKGTTLLGVRVVVAESFERIHRSNLIGMGVLPLQFEDGTSWKSLGITGKESFTIKGADSLSPGLEVTLLIDGKKEVPLLCRLDTPVEVKYYQSGGIMPYVLRKLIQK